MQILVVAFAITASVVAFVFLLATSTSFDFTKQGMAFAFSSRYPARYSVTSSCSAWLPVMNLVEPYLAYVP
jgi:hypothetical protein